MNEELDGPIEIELTSHAPARERRRRAGSRSGAASTASASEPTVGDRSDRSDQPSTADSDPPAGWLDSERSRLVVTAGAVAVVALLIGWMLGRSGDATSVGDAAATASDVASTDATPDESKDDDPAFENAEELPDPDARLDDLIVSDTVTPPVSLSETTTTTLVTADAVEPEPVEIAVDERLVGLAMEVFAIDAQRRLIGLDLATGEATVRGEQFIVSPDQMIAGPGWVLATGYNNQSITIDFDDGVRTSIQVPDPWSLMVDTSQSRFWSRSVRIDTPVYDEYRLDGFPTGRSVELPSFGWPQTVDAGAIVTSSVGSVFRISPDGHEVIARGELLELSSEVAVVNTCDDDLRCGLQVVDRATGEARWVPEPVDDDADGRRISYYPINARYGRADGSLSPDGSRLAVARSTSLGEVIGILELETGEFTDVSGVSLAENWTWGPDGRFAFFREGRVPMVNDTDTNETFPLSPDGLSWTTLTGRRTPPGPIG